MQAAIRAAIERAGGWIGFDRFMAMALYEPGLGYYSRSSRMFGTMPTSGSDFVTAPELSPLFGRALARQLAQALAGTGTREIWEFGAGSGALAAEVLALLGGEQVERYTIVDLSGALQARQRERLASFGDRVCWVDALPAAIEGVILGNEVLDAMPVTLIAFDGERWHERGVVVGPERGREPGQAREQGHALEPGHTREPGRADEPGRGHGQEHTHVRGSRSGRLRGRRPDAAFADTRYAWSDRPTTLRPPVDAPFAAGTVTELHPQAEAFVATLAERLVRGAAFFIDYGFPAAEYHHPQRTGGTLMCHRAHRADADPLVDVGAKDLTAHVDFTGLALAGQAAGLDVLGYTTQAHFLINCGIGELLAEAELATRAHAQKLLTEHEMGELFKVIGFAKGADAAFTAAPLGFAQGDRTHRL